MSVNYERPHLIIIPEDDRDRQIVNGLLAVLPQGANVRALPSAGGWHYVAREFEKNEVRLMQRYVHRMVLLVVDFDGTNDRREKLLSLIGEEILARFGDRLFVLGSATTPEKLGSAMGKSYESIGEALAEDCRGGARGTWNHPLLAHNTIELDRMGARLRAILFP